MNDIAIASVPVQAWEKPYDLKEALCQGTIFQTLRKPFYTESQDTQAVFQPENDYERKLLEIQQTGFFITDLTLFLDTHPNHTEAMAMRQEMQQKLMTLREQFAQQFHALDCFQPGNAKCEVAPWEGGTKNVDL